VSHICSGKVLHTKHEILIEGIVELSPLSTSNTDFDSLPRTDVMDQFEHFEWRYFKLVEPVNKEG